MRLYWHETGPLIRYEGGLLEIEDLNPHVRTHWRMSRWEMIRFAFKTLIAGVRG